MKVQTSPLRIPQFWSQVEILHQIQIVEWSESIDVQILKKGQSYWS
jgi:hypothetical protein